MKLKISWADADGASKAIRHRAASANDTFRCMARPFRLTNAAPSISSNAHDGSGTAAWEGDPFARTNFPRLAAPLPAPSVSSKCARHELYPGGVTSVLGHT